MRLSGVVGAVSAAYLAVTARAACSVPVVPGQYLGDVIPNSLPEVVNTEIAFFKVKDPSGQYVCSSSSVKSNLTLINYMSLNSTGGRVVQSNIQRAVIVIHGLNRDPATYEANMLSALGQVTGDSTINRDTVAVMAPYFPSGADKGVGYPWNATGQYSWQRAYTSALVWYGSDWSAGAINQYPSRTTTVSSYDALDQVVQWFGSPANFPNLKQIVIAGHSLGAQMVQRYAAVGKTPAQLGVSVPITYWIGDPNSLVWPNETRPLTTSTCPDYDVYREGFTNYTEYGADQTVPMTYNLDLVNSGRANILANFQSKAINWARATLDFGDQSNGCGPYTTGKDRNERFFNFIKQFPPSCANPAGGNCDTVDLVNAGHDAGVLFADPAGRARLFTDNWNGNGARAYDFGYPRETTYDDPYPDPSQKDQPLMNTDTTTYAGGMKYAGCWSDSDEVQKIHTLRNLLYSGSSNSRDYCTNTCVQSGYTIAGLSGDNCYCASNVSSEAAEVVSTSCQVACPGNSAQICGNNIRLSLFSTGEIKHLQPPKNPSSIGNFTEAGCYTDEAPNVRALTGLATASATDMSLEYCAKYCTGYKYFGVEYGQECYCGNALDASSNLTASGECSFQCPANELEYCGAGYRLTLYVDNNWTGAVPTSTSAGGSTPTGSAITCPDSNNTIYTSNGRSFQVECGIDHFGGDLATANADTLAGCLDACAANADCVDVSMSGAACYLKSSLGDGLSNPGINGGKLVASSATSTVNTNVNQASSTTTSTSTSTSTTTTSSTSASTTTSSSTSTSTSTSLSTSSTTTTSSSTSTSTTTSTSTSSTTTTSSSTSSSTTKSSSTSSSTGATTSTVPTTSTSSVQTSSTTSSTATSSTTLSCPASNNTIYTSNGKSFQIECGIDRFGNDIASKEVASIKDCIDYCATLNGCVDISLLGGTCYAKGTIGTAASAPIVHGAKLVSSSSTTGSSVATTSTTPSTSKTTTSSTTSTPTSSSSSSTRTTSSSTSSATSSTSSTSSTTSSTLTTSTRTSTSSSASATATLSCPASNNTVYTAPSGNKFLIECDIDHSEGDMLSKDVASFAACINLCDSTPGCVDISMQGAGCYLKKTLGKAVAKKGILGAKLVTSTSAASPSATASA